MPCPSCFTARKARVARRGFILPLLVLLEIPSVAIGQVRTIERSSLPRSMDVALRAGTLRIIDSARATPVPSAASNVNVEKGQFLAAATKESARTMLRPISRGMAGLAGSRTVDTLTILPFRIVGTAADNQAVDLQPAVIRDLPLRYQPDAGIFRGSLLVGLQDNLAPTVRRNIGAPIPLTLASDGSTSDSTRPREVQIRYTNYPLERVMVFASGARDSVGVRVITQALGGSVVWLPVHPSLVFDAPRTLSGLGIGTVSFPVRLIGVSVRDTVLVTLAVDPGSLSEPNIKIGASGSAMVHLRSAGTGPARLTATSPGIDTAMATIEFGWPIGFLVAALLGGALGGAGKYMRGGQGRKSHLLKPVLGGAVIGLIVAIAYYAVNVTLLPVAVKVPFFNEAAVFALGMLGAFLGIRKSAGTTV